MKCGESLFLIVGAVKAKDDKRKAMMTQSGAQKKDLQVMFIKGTH